MAKLDEIINYLQGEGLMPRKDEDGDILFKYQMKNFIIFDTTDDEQYLQIALPGIYDVNEENLVEVLAACNSVSRSIKVAKAIVTGDNKSVWVVYESMLDTTPVYGDIIPRSLEILLAAQRSFYETING
ncbi:MAG: hypothetical protein IKZ61_00480 [Prevotella sp.]|nr:hypothetical protein [Prevotella sp.]MBR4924209.1 hypothetical protein [Prevotella sp.]